MSKANYDFLNVLTYVGILFFITLYKTLLTGVEIWKMMLASLCLFFVMTSLMLINSKRLNIEGGLSDEGMNVFIFFLGTNSISVIGSIPVQVSLTYLVPHNVEASTMALVTGVMVWSYEVGAKISASIYC